MRSSDLSSNNPRTWPRARQRRAVGRGIANVLKNQRDNTGVHLGRDELQRHHGAVVKLQLLGIAEFKAAFVTVMKYRFRKLGIARLDRLIDTQPWLHRPFQGFN